MSFFALRKSHLVNGIAVSVLCLAVSAPAGAGSPQWFRDVARTALPSYPDETRGVKLLDEQVTTVSDSGDVKTINHVVIKILRAHGRALGTISIPFDSDTKVSNVHAWAQPPQGSEYELKEKDAVETSLVGESLYSDDRAKIFSLPSEPGTVIGYEYEQKQRPELFMDTWRYQSSIPVLAARYTLSLPNGWELETYWVNHPKMDPVRTGNSYTWQDQNVPAIKTEPNMPAWRAVAGRMEVAFFGPNGKSSRAHTSWEDVGNWYFRMADPQRQVTPQVQTAAGQLVAGKTAFLDKVHAIATFAQRDVRYVAIEIGVGGYKPHDSSSIYANRYGDCKDKVTLMSAMLNSVGIRSHYVLTHNDRGVIAKDAPTMRSFNHVIIAIEVPKTEKLPARFQAVLHHSKLGDLLLFDPTDDLTSIGYLPPWLQSNYGLLVLQQGSDVIPFPAHAPEANGLVRTAKLTLEPDGHLSGEVKEVRSGSHARAKRYELLTLQSPQRRRAFEDFLSSFLTGFSLKDFSIEHLNDYDDDLVITYSFGATGYSKSMGPLLLVRPRVFGSKAEALEARDRKLPFELDAASMQTDEFDITLPAGYTVDELPAPLNLQSSGLKYQSASNFSGQTLTYKRTYEVDNVYFPLDKVKDLQSFYGQVLLDERNSAVLKKQ